MSNKDEYFAMMESQIRKWDAEVDKLRAKSAQMSAEARIKYEEQLMAMRANRDAANKKLQEIRTASEAAWQNMQDGLSGSHAGCERSSEPHRRHHARRATNLRRRRVDPRGRIRSAATVAAHRGEASRQACRT